MRRPSTDVLIVGAGPVGLLTALALTRRGITVKVIDRAERSGTRNYAAGLHPRSLEILKEFGLDSSLERNLKKVEKLTFHTDGTDATPVTLPSDGDKPMALGVVSQSQLERLLEDALSHAGVQVQWNHRLATFDQDKEGVTATVQRLEESITGYAVAHFDWSVAEEYTMRARFLIGTDGHLSLVRRRLKIDLDRVGDREHFAVYEFDSDRASDSGIEIDPDLKRTCALWPMPGKSWRFSFRVPEKASMWESREKDHLLVQIGRAAYPLLDRELLEQLVKERAPWWNSSIGHIRWRVAVAFEKHLAQAYGHDRVWLAGDSAHTTGPVGMQSMNVGLREALSLASAVETALRDTADGNKALHDYEKRFRAEWGQLLGVSSPPVPQENAPAWAKRKPESVLELLPSSGKHLRQLCKALRLDLPEPGK